MRYAYLLLLCLLLSWPAAAADLSQVDAQVRAELAQARQELRQTRQEIARRRQEVKQRLATAQAALEREQSLLATRRRELEQAHERRRELARQVEARSGDLKELAGNVRAAARDLLTLAENSPLTPEVPDRLAMLKGYLDKERYPELEDIKRLVDEYFREIQAAGELGLRHGRLVDRAGEEVEGELARLGAFCTLYRTGDEVGFALVGPSSGRLLASSAEPSWWMRRKLNQFLDGAGDQVYLDISGGAALRRLSRRVGLWEQILSGGPLVWPILLVGVIALGLILERLFFLRRVRANTDVLMDEVNRLVAEGDFEGALEAAEAQAGRPTSNVIKAGLGMRGAPLEAVDSALSEAMLRELPRLERFLTALKVLAAVAPLLGLLGTVTGMIKTFHVITVFGSGDPRLMAGGISEALVTTELGLAVAIPIMVAAALLGRKAQRIVGDMEEKAVALSAALIRQGA